MSEVSDPNTITNDGATILKSVPVENLAANVLVDIAKIQDDITRFFIFNFFF
jgi:T-complex protein 1 subunit beta